MPEYLRSNKLLTKNKKSLYNYRDVSDFTMSAFVMLTMLTKVHIFLISLLMSTFQKIVALMQTQLQTVI